MIKSAAAVSTFMLVVQVCSAQTLDFKGVPLGSTLEKLESVITISDRNCVKLDAGTTQSCWGSTDSTYAGEKIRTISVDLLDERVSKITVATLGGTGDIIRSALTSKYGKATGTRFVSKTLKNGIKYKLAVTEWKTKSGDLISVDDYPQPVNEVYTSVISSAWRKWQVNSTKADSKAKADI